MSIPQQQLPNNDDSLLKQAIDVQKKKLRNKILKKGAKLAIAAIKTVAATLAKVLMAILSYIGFPVVLIGAIIILVVIIISLAMSYFHATGEGLEGQEKEMYEYIVEQSNSTVDMSNPIEKQYRVPPELIAAAIQIDAFQEYDDIDDIKRIIRKFVKALKPSFDYGEYNEWVETKVTTCIDGECKSNTSKSNNSVQKLDEVQSWKGTTTFTYEGETSDWSTTSTEKEEVPTVIWDSKEKKFVESSKSVTKTVEERKQYFTSTQSTVDDYAQLDNILNSFNLGLNDKKLIEINYMFAGGDSNYTNWIEGKSFNESYNGGLVYSCSPTGEINMVNWKTAFSQAGVLAGADKEIIEIAEQKGIDPVLFAAIAIHETAWGKSNAVRNYNNPGGLMNPKTDKLFRFSSLSEGLQSMGRTLYNRIRVDGLNTIEKLGNVYAPIGVKNDPTGLNKNWIPVTQGIAAKLGGLTMNCETPVLGTDESTSGVAVVDVGKKWIGNSKYVFGGGRNQSDIARGRFDCSSFVHWAFKQVGVDLGTLGWTSTETLKNKGTAVSVSQMQPGDIVFFNTYKTDGHVGIYVGNGKFIGAQSSTGVAIADMSSGYWKQKFNGRVKRIIN